MAKFSIKNKLLFLPGILISIFILFFVIYILITLINIKNYIEFNYYFIDKNYFINVLYFSFLQSILSTIISIFLSILISSALNRRNFFMKQTLINIFSIILVLPVLIAIIGIINVYGKNGWLSKLFHVLNIEYNYSPYGMSGILLTHIFFNVPLATNIFLKQLKIIPIEKIYISEVFNIHDWSYFRFIEWPYLKVKIKSVILIIFILCFSSLTIILTLGGGKLKYINIETAIFYALSYEFNPKLAGILSILKIIFCIIIFLFLNDFNKNYYFNKNLENSFAFKKTRSFLIFFIDLTAILSAILLVMPPMLSLVINSLNKNIQYIIQDYKFWNAIINSLKISFASGFLALFLSIILVLTIRYYFFNKYFKLVIILEMSNIILFSIPNITLATGIFLIANKYQIISCNFIYYLIIFINALMSMPLVIKIINQSFFNIYIKYNKLCLSLNIKGWKKLKFIELNALKNYLSKAFSISCILSMGDLSIISLFGKQEFYTLPSYIYEKFSSYHYEDATLVSLILLFICLFIFKINNQITKYI